MNGGLTVHDIEAMKRDRVRLDFLEKYCSNPIRRYIDDVMACPVPAVAAHKPGEPVMRWDPTTKIWHWGRN